MCLDAKTHRWALLQTHRLRGTPIGDETKTKAQIADLQLIEVGHKYNIIIMTFVENFVNFQDWFDGQV